MEEDLYPCVGICTADPDSGYCLGCGRPPLESPVVVAVHEIPSTPALPVSGNSPAIGDE